MTNDCIEKRAAFNALWGVFCGADEDGKRIVGECFKAVEALPTAQPQRMRGRWEYLDYGGVGNYHCSACRMICINKGDYDFCPFCGADMRGATNEV